MQFNGAEVVAIGYNANDMVGMLDRNRDGLLEGGWKEREGKGEKVDEGVADGRGQVLGYQELKHETAVAIGTTTRSLRSIAPRIIQIDNFPMREYDGGSNKNLFLKGKKRGGVGTVDHAHEDVRTDVLDFVRGKEGWGGDTDREDYHVSTSFFFYYRFHISTRGNMLHSQ